MSEKITPADLEAAKQCLQHAFRNVECDAMVDVDFQDVAEHFARHRITTIQRQDERVRELEAGWRPIETAPKDGGQFGDLDAGTPNHFDPSKRGFQP